MKKLRINNVKRTKILIACAASILILFLCALLLALFYLDDNGKEGREILAAAIDRIPNASTHKILIVVPGLSFHNKGRMGVLENSLDTLFSSALDMDCLIYVYKGCPHDRPGCWPPSPARSWPRLRNCTVQMYLDGNYAYFLKAVTPALVVTSKYTHVVLLLDDVKLNQHEFNLRSMLHVMDKNRLSIASPKIPDSHHCDIPRQHEHSKAKVKIGRVVKFIEIFADVFTAEAWSCWWEILNPAINSNGWGYDLALHDFCRPRIKDFKMGIIQCMFAWHQTHHGRISNLSVSVQHMDAFFVSLNLTGNRRPSADCYLGEELIA